MRSGSQFVSRILTTGISSALVGVMVAVALLPPLVVFSMLLPVDPVSAGRALLLLAINVICVNLAGVATFWIQKVVPALYWEAARARTATRRAFILWVSLLGALLAWILLKTNILH